MPVPSPASSRVDVATLLGLGLEERLAQLWTAMAAAPGAGVAELAHSLGISESDARERLDALADRALVRASQQTPGLLVPVTVETAMKQLLRRQEEELAEQQRRIEEQRDRIEKTVADSVEAAADDDGVEHIVGADAIHARFEQITHRITTSVESLMPTTGLPAQMLADAKPLDLELLQRGVAFRSLYLEAVRNDPPLLAYAREIATAGADIRTSPALPQRLFIADRRIAVVPLDPADRGRGVALVRAPAVVASLVELFESVWHLAAPLDVGNPVDTATGLSDTERTLLKMLAEGATDETAAKKLGVSLRTVRRIMADLMHRLDAGSRFEAGIKAAKRGWL